MLHSHGKSVRAIYISVYKKVLFIDIEAALHRFCRLHFSVQSILPGHHRHLYRETAPWRNRSKLQHIVLRDASRTFLHVVIYGQATVGNRLQRQRCTSCLHVFQSREKNVLAFPFRQPVRNTQIHLLHGSLVMLVTRMTGQQPDCTSPSGKNGP